MAGGPDVSSKSLSPARPRVPAVAFVAPLPRSELVRAERPALRNVPLVPGFFKPQLQP